MASFFSDNEDLQFYFDKAIDWSALAEVSELGFRHPEGHKNGKEAATFYREVIEMVGTLAAEQVAPHGAAVDREGAWLENGEAHVGAAATAVAKVFSDAELHRLCPPREFGGLNAPLLVYFLCAEMLARADVSTMTHLSFTGGMALATLVFSMKEGSTTFDQATGKIERTRFRAEIEEMTRGEAWGAMDITEPNAGSDMAQLRAVGEQDESGNWFVTGQKIFITSGHAKYHFVIARTETPKDANDPFSGLAGLSMFMVPAYEDRPDGTRRRWVTIDRVEEKIGHHGSVTAALSFDRAPAELLGKRGEGFAYMLVLMNNARLGVGFESIGVMEAAYRLAKTYAEERRSMGKPIGRHEMIADYLDEMRTDIQGARAIAATAAFDEEMAQKLALFEKTGTKVAEGATKKIAEHRRRARRLTPLLKYFAAEKAVEVARRSIQIHGGVGYTKDYAAERLLRDALVFPIYEGTSQIQSLMAMKDTLIGIMKKPQRFLRRLAQARLDGMTARDPLERRVAKVAALSLSAQQFLITRVAAGKLRTLADVPASTWRATLTKEWDPKRDFALAMLHAERLTRLLVDEAVTEVLLDQARKFPERREVLARFLDRCELRDRALHDEITTTGERILASLAEEEKAAAAE